MNNLALLGIVVLLLIGVRAAVHLIESYQSRDQKLNHRHYFIVLPGGKK